MIWPLLVGSAPAWDDIGSTWPDMPVPYYIAADLGSLEDPATIDAIVAGFDTWAAVECTRVRFDYRGRTNDVFGTTDDQNTVSFVNLGWPENVTGPSSDVLRTGGGAILEADIALNTGDFLWVVDGADGVETLDIQSGITHEVGRLLGLRDSTDPDASSNPRLAGDPKGRSLGDDDLEALCTLYPAEDAAGSVGLGGSCDDASDCAEPYRCIADAGEQYCAPRCPGGLCPADFLCYEEADVCTKAGCGCATGAGPGGLLSVVLLLALRARGARARGAVQSGLRA